MGKEYRVRPLLKKYYTNYQKNILLAYRPTLKHTWSDRVLFLSKEFEPRKEYNHRMVLDEEIVFEYDFDDLKENKRLVDIIARRLTENNIKWSKWYSGGKSYHLHCIVNVKEATDIALLKRSFMSFFTKDLPRPDMQLCSPHLIRMEYGVNEKTGNRKKLVSKDKEYPYKGKVPQPVWDEYQRRKKISIANQAVWNTKELANSKEVKLLLNTIKIREVGDGRERSLWVLIHVLKGQYDTKEELTAFLVDWYKYSGGKRLATWEIKNKIDQQYNRPYKPGIGYIRNLLDDLGVTEQQKTKDL